MTALNQACLGRTYGPFRYELGIEKMREFANAVCGGSPWSGPAPELHPYLHDEAASKAGPYGAVIAFPTFAATFCITPFYAALNDPDLHANLLMLVHGEQEFEFFDVMRAGDTLSTQATIAEIYERASLDFVVVQTESTNQHGRVVVRGKWTAVIRR